MKVIGGDERLKEIASNSSCPKCGGTGYGEMYLDVFGNPDIGPCDDCGGSGDMESYQRYLQDLDF